MSDDFPWPDPVTLAAGDEDIERDPYMLSPFERAQARGFQEDGELETLDWWRRHPDGDE